MYLSDTNFPWEGQNKNVFRYLGTRKLFHVFILGKLLGNDSGRIRRERQKRKRKTSKQTKEKEDRTRGSLPKYKSNPRMKLWNL